MVFKSFPDLIHKPLLVDMTIEEGIRFKVIYGSKEGFHAVDLDNGQVYDIYTPAHVWRFMLFNFFFIECFPLSTDSRASHTAHYCFSSKF